MILYVDDDELLLEFEFEDDLLLIDSVCLM